ncbi:MAG: hypothetical protein IJ193_02110 [Bacilli bacterium]|nr:hypothetical protein [Bacilli bacterium]
MDRNTEINNLITHIALKTEGITTEQIERAREMYKDDPRDIEDIERELWEYSGQIREEYYKSILQEPNDKETQLKVEEDIQPNDNANESDMINNISQTLERQDIIDDISGMSDYLIEQDKPEAALAMVSNAIGSVFLYHIIHKDGYNFDNYYYSLMDLYKKGLSPEEFNTEKSKLIMESIKSRLNITSEQMTPEEDKRVRDYFLTQYVEKGYVAHSFPSSAYQSIRENGLSAKKREWGKDEVKELSEIFSSHNVPGAFGGYPYYEGEGLYYEHNMEWVYRHGLYSPEWLNVFTSADHYIDLGDLSKNPYIFRTGNKKDPADQACVRNVEDLIHNSELNSEEANQVRDFFDRQWKTLETPGSNVALIPKSIVGKDNKELAADGTTTALETIKNSLTDSGNQYKEHVGNVYNGEKDIPYTSMVVIKLPSVRKYINNIEFKRETKEELRDSKKHDAFMQHVKEQKENPKSNVGMRMTNEQANKKIDRIGDDNTVPRDVRIARLKNIRSQVVKKASKKNEMNGMFHNNQVHHQPENHIQQASKVMVKSNGNKNNQGYANSLLIIAISIMTLITSILLYLVK